MRQCGRNYSAAPLRTTWVALLFGRQSIWEEKLQLFCGIKLWDTIMLLSKHNEPRQDGQHFTYDIFKLILLGENCCILIQISLNAIPEGPNNTAALAQVLVQNGSGDKPLSEQMLAQFTRRRHFQINFLMWKLLYFGSHLTEICTQKFNWQYAIFGSDQATNHYLNQGWLCFLTHMCDTHSICWWSDAARCQTICRNEKATFGLNLLTKFKMT